MFRYSGPCHQPRGKSLQQVLPSVRPPQLAQLPSQHAAVTHCRAQAQSGPGKPPADEIAQEILPQETATLQLPCHNARSHALLTSTSR